MKTLVLAAAAAAALAGATAAHAASGTVSSSFDGTTGTFSDRNFTTPGFNDTFDFTNVPAGEYNIIIGTATPGVDFTKITFDGATVPYSQAFQSGLLNDFMVGPGVQTLVVEGTYNSKVGGSYAGTVQFNAVSAAPEPATWSLMIAGVALVGGALRLGRRNGWSATAA
jgi:hypothetical protein